MVHGLVWTPEGKLMMNQGCSTTSKIRAVGVDGVEREWDLKEGDFFRCWPDGTGFEIIFHGFTNCWGYDWDDYGNWICNDNEGPHLIHLVEGGDYGFSLTNRHDGKPGTLPGIETDHTQHYGYLVQSELTIYSGDAFPKEYQGNVLQGAPNLHKVIRDSLEERGATFFGTMEGDLTSSDDLWHRPIALTVGPDGAVYMIDWYNEILAHVEHPLDSPRRDKTRGRIYRIAWKTAPKFKPPDLRKATPEDLIANLRSDNKWLRRTSQRVLAERLASEHIEKSNLLRLLKADETSRTRCHVLWTLEEVHHGDVELIKAATTLRDLDDSIQRSLDDGDAHVRAVALRIAQHADPRREFAILSETESTVIGAHMEFFVGEELDGFSKQVFGLTQDSNDFVKFEAATLISKLPSSMPIEKATDLILHADWEDPFLSHAFTAAIEPQRDQLLTRAYVLGAQGLNADDHGLIEALIHLRDPRLEPFFLAFLQLSDLKPHVAEQVLTGLQDYHSPIVARAVLQFLAGHPNLEINQAKPILADLRRRPLSEIEADQRLVMQTLHSLAKVRKDGLLREVFLTAARVGKLINVEYSDDYDLAYAIFSAFEHSESQIAEAAILAAGEIKPKSDNQQLQIRPDLWINLVKQSNGRRKWAAVEASSKVGDSPMLVGEFLIALADPDTAGDGLAGLRRFSQEGKEKNLLDRVLERVNADQFVVNHATAKQLSDWIQSEPDGENRRRHFQILAEKEGILRDWKIIGPFPNPDTKGHSTPYPPESALDANAEYESLGQKIRWQNRRAEDRWGIVDLTWMKPNDHVVAYGWTTFPSKEERDAVLYCGSDDSIKVWLNGKLVHDNLIDRGLSVDQDQAPVHLRAGENTILLKCGQNGGGWNFHARIATLPPEVARDPGDLEKRALYLSGDPARGEKVFFGSVGCHRCHAVGDKGGRVGPDLTQVARYNPKSYIVRSILHPSEEIAEGYGGMTITTKDNRDYEGYIHRESPDEVFLVTAEGKTIPIRKDQIKERRAHSLSGMPEDIAKSLKPEELVDLVAYLEERR